MELARFGKEGDPFPDLEFLGQGCKVVLAGGSEEGAPPVLHQPLLEDMQMWHRAGSSLLPSLCLAKPCEQSLNSMTELFRGSQSWT